MRYVICDVSKGTYDEIARVLRTQGALVESRDAIDATATLARFDHGIVLRCDPGREVLLRDDLLLLEELRVVLAHCRADQALKEGAVPGDPAQRHAADAYGMVVSRLEEIVSRHKRGAQ